VGSKNMSKLSKRVRVHMLPGSMFHYIHTDKKTVKDHNYAPVRFDMILHPVPLPMDGETNGSPWSQGLTPP
jgi:hypothetical protein